MKLLTNVAYRVFVARTETQDLSFNILLQAEISQVKRRIDEIKLVVSKKYIRKSRMLMKVIAILVYHASVVSNKSYFFKRRSLSTDAKTEAFKPIFLEKNHI